MYDVNDPKNYKRCQKKKYNVWVCMPPLGTCVMNKLEHARFAGYIGKRLWYYSGNMKEMKNGPLREVYAFLVKNAYITNEKNRFVISGTQGELQIIDSYNLAKSYIFVGDAISTDEEISLRSLRARCIYNGDRMDWQLLETKADKNDYFACHVPANKMFTLRTQKGDFIVGNDPIVPHGKGDFIVCTANADNTPNLNDRWIVNGLIFGDTYNNEGWSDKLINGMEGFKFIERPKFSLMSTYDDDTYIDPAKIYEDDDDEEGTCWVNPVVLRNMNSSKKSAIEQIIQEKFKGKRLQVASKQRENNMSKIKDSKVKEVSRNTSKKRKETVLYQIIARCIDGNKLTGYMLKTIDGSQVKLMSKQEAYALASKGKIENCIGKISKDEVSLSGVGIRIRDLPIVDKNGNMIRRK